MLRARVALLLLGIAATVSFAAAAAAARGHARLRAELARVHRDHAAHDARLTAVSQLFVGKPFALSPLGEGAGAQRDPDPIARFDQFDCVTYIEQVMALSWFGDLDEAVRQLQRIRYSRGVVDYAKRNHIMMAQWIPQNVAAGFVRDITTQVAGKRRAFATLQLTDASFETEAGKALQLRRGERPLGRYRVAIVPLAHISQSIARIPHGTILTTIRRARADRPYRASHLGIVVVKDGVRRIRHAHQGRDRVVDERLSRFVATARKPKRLPIVGFNLLAIANDAPPASSPH